MHSYSGLKMEPSSKPEMALKLTNNYTTTTLPLERALENYRVQLFNSFPQLPRISSENYTISNSLHASNAKSSVAFKDIGGHRRREIECIKPSN